MSTPSARLPSYATSVQGADAAVFSRLEGLRRDGRAFERMQADPALATVLKQLGKPVPATHFSPAPASLTKPSLSEIPALRRALRNLRPVIYVPSKKSLNSYTARTINWVSHNIPYLPCNWVQEAKVDSSGALTPPRFRVNPERTHLKALHPTIEKVLFPAIWTIGRVVATIAITTLVSPIGVLVHTAHITHHAALYALAKLQKREAEPHLKEIKERLAPLGCDLLATVIGSLSLPLLNPVALMAGWSPGAAASAFTPQSLVKETDLHHALRERGILLELKQCHPRITSVESKEYLFKKESMLDNLRQLFDKVQRVCFNNELPPPKNVKTKTREGAIQTLLWIKAVALRMEKLKKRYCVPTFTYRNPLAAGQLYHDIFMETEEFLFSLSQKEPLKTVHSYAQEIQKLCDRGLLDLHLSAIKEKACPTTDWKTTSALIGLCIPSVIF